MEVRFSSKKSKKYKNIYKRTPKRRKKNQTKIKNIKLNKKANFDFFFFGGGGVWLCVLISAEIGL